MLWLKMVVSNTGVKASKAIKVAGMGGVITTKQRNIEELGFPEDLHGKADGLFLDLPGPWHVSPP